MLTLLSRRSQRRLRIRRHGRMTKILRLANRQRLTIAQAAPLGRILTALHCWSIRCAERNHTTAWLL